MIRITEAADFGAARFTGMRRLTRLKNIFLNWPSLASFSFIFIFSNKLHNFYTKQMWKMSIQYMVLGFETTTFETWFSHNH